MPWEECARLTREHAGAGGSVPRGTKRVECRGGRRASAARCWLRLKWMTSPPASAASVCLKRRDEPTVVFKSMSLSLCGYRALQLPPYTPPVKMLARVQNVRPIRPIRDIKADAIGEAGEPGPRPRLRCRQARAATPRGSSPLAPALVRRFLHGSPGQCCSSGARSTVGRRHGVSVCQVPGFSSVPV